MLRNMVPVTSGFHARNNFSKSCQQFGHAPSGRFATPVLRLKKFKWYPFDGDPNYELTRGTHISRADRAVFVWIFRQIWMELLPWRIVGNMSLPCILCVSHRFISWTSCPIYTKFRMDITNAMLLTFVWLVILSWEWHNAAQCRATLLLRAICIYVSVNWQ